LFFFFSSFHPSVTLYLLPLPPSPPPLRRCNYGIGPEVYFFTRSAAYSPASSTFSSSRPLIDGLVSRRDTKLKRIFFAHDRNDITFRQSADDGGIQFFFFFFFSKRWE
jgi:hypothetical protein